ncbi:MAG: hypothetical protein SGJ27_21735 [Candidatus Melainabacteria bacterium]|nr:hypothetical protein [Candidatus Melainabacteria bacterium]
MLSPTVEKFIKDNIESVWQLELLLYARARTDSLGSHELAAALYTSPDAVENALNHFERVGLLKKCPYDQAGFIYSPINSSLKDSVDQTATAFAARKVAIIQYIFSHPDLARKSTSEHAKVHPQPENAD